MLRWEASRVDLPADVSLEIASSLPAVPLPVPSRNLQRGAGFHPFGGTILQIPYASASGLIFSMYDRGLPANSSTVGKKTGAAGTSNRLPSAGRFFSSLEFCIAWWRKRSSAAVVA